ncbi:poly-beta-1,6-N-acetyl-D-glucosamine biosynthesis protein PgaD [Burkholderiaceae bacterium FT117]|uniref:poly-beta-1,6-N-acetyl-D-glucosamine biosynthesis protein PgaD n=1 Tax=Zeimonas sediminis TaxID=2944268 RepID=UPI002342F157|nr:poly-beta-1,6-N-acetyl-D-glucosamine biosynthesis protein PgaD [Zeimonas sediminis]MCM5571527.1 poly-beta-1,6-N-acetyl-D-glucosamine biosynthesis protein PgaD [Zeimonas sediminis]
MEKPRPGTASPRPLIIERPDLQSRPQRVASATLTAFFWALWVYLWLPVLALVGWWFGATRFYDEMVRQEGYRPLVEMLGWYAICIGLLAGSLILWALYNLGRFRGRERRKARPVVLVSQVAARAGLDADQLLAWHRARILHVTHDDDGRIVSVTPVPVPDAGGTGENAGAGTVSRSRTLA